MHVQTAAGSTAGTTKVDNFRIWSANGNPVFNDGFETGLTILWSSSCSGGSEICGSGPPIPF
jgi:hypothetical protein